MPAHWQYREGYWGPKTVKAEAVGAELERIKSTGDWTTSRVVEESRPNEAVLHPIVFDKDTEQAAEEYYLIRAREVMRSVVYIEEATPQNPHPIPDPIVHVPSKNKKGEGKYDFASNVAKDVDEFERAIRAARADLDAAERRFSELRFYAEKRGGKVEALAIAAQGFSAVREALDLLKAG